MSDLLGTECEHGQLKRSCQICDNDELIQRLRAELQNCVVHMGMTLRGSPFADLVKATGRANKLLDETVGV